MKRGSLNGPLGLLAWRRYRWLKPECVKPVPQPITVNSREEFDTMMWEIMREQMEDKGLRCTLFNYITQEYEDSGAEPGMYSLPHGIEERSYQEIRAQILRGREHRNEEYNAVRMRFESAEWTENMVPIWFIIVLNGCEEKKKDALLSPEPSQEAMKRWSLMMPYGIPWFAPIWVNSEEELQDKIWVNLTEYMANRGLICTRFNFFLLEEEKANARADEMWLECHYIENTEVFSKEELRQRILDTAAEKGQFSAVRMLFKKAHNSCEEYWIMIIMN